MKELFDFVLNLFNLPFVIQGYTVTLWQFFLFVIIGTMLMRVVYSLFDR